MTYGYENLKLEKGMYAQSGKSFSRVLESLDPSENYRGTALEGLDAGVDLLPGGLRTEAQAHHAAGGLFGQMQRGHHLAGLALVAGGAGGDADALRAELGDDVRARIADERDGEDMRGVAVPDAHHAIDGE